MKFKSIETFDTYGVPHCTAGPAEIWADGEKSWYLNGRLHRTDGPASLYADGTKGWWSNGRWHREDGPARIWPDGEKSWWLNHSCFGFGNKPPEWYLEKLEEMGIEFVRGSDEG
jgi:hypothetical protein